MFQLVTNAEIKTNIIKDLSDPNGHIKCVFASSSLSMGINLSNINYIIHYGAPTTVGAFLQETGRAAREQNSIGHSILMHWPAMVRGRRLETEMNLYRNSVDHCLREILLSKFSCEKPTDQQPCCALCDHSSCQVLDLMRVNADSPAASDSEDDDCARAEDIEEM